MLQHSRYGGFRTQAQTILRLQPDHSAPYVLRTRCYALVSRYQLDLLSLGPDAPNAIKARSALLCIAWHSFALLLTNGLVAPR